MAGHEGMFLFMAFLLIVSYSIKSCLFPFHGWTKIVTEAAPVAASGAISGVVTKTGVIAVIRIVASMIGADILRDTWVQYVWMVLAVLSIFIGAVLAYKTDALAERMAYSTVGQVGCVLYGVSLMEKRAVTGSLIRWHLSSCFSQLGRSSIRRGTNGPVSCGGSEDRFPT